MSDLINKPPHYLKGRIECLDFILDQQLPFLAGQVVKYVVRYRHKGTPLADVQKAQFYLNRLVEEVRREEASILRGGDYGRITKLTVVPRPDEVGGHP